jgi:predicted NAD/FAD-dependent oxidoreductase
MSRIAVIGAGIGGLTLAHQLVGNHDVVVFEKGRGLGGRTASRYAGAYAFDHGAQYFTVRDERFSHLLAPIFDAGHIAAWIGPVARIGMDRAVQLSEPLELRFVGVPNMNNLAKALAAPLDVVRTGVDIAPLAERTAQGWALMDVSGTNQGQFDWVVSTTTPHQTLALFDRFAPVDGPLRNARMLPCYALMLGFARPIETGWSSASLEGSALDWIGINSSKPGRDHRVTTLVAHSTTHWAQEHLDGDPVQLQALLEAAVRDAIGVDPQDAEFRGIHRWRSARVAGKERSEPFINELHGLAATGDWARGSRVESVVLSALELAQRIDAAGAPNR